MDFKSLLSQLDQLNETEGTTVHKGTYGNSYGKEDVRDQYGQRIGKVDKGAEAKKDAPKKGRGRPKKGADDSGEVKKYDFSAFGVQQGKDVKLPKYDKKKTTKHSLKEYFDSLDKQLSEMQGQPIPVVGKQGDTQSTGAGFLHIDDTSPAGQAMSKALGDLAQQKKAQIVMPTQQQTSGTQQKPSATSGGATNQPAMSEEDEDYSAKKARAGKDIGKPGKNFDKIVKSSGGGEKGKRIAGAILAKLRGLKEADLPPQDGLMGAGLGAGRDQGVTEGKKPDFLDLDKDGNKKEPMQKAAQDKKKVKESMNKNLLAARLAGKSHGLKGQAHCGNNYDDMEEARMYHEGYKEGLDECYGQMPIRGLVDEIEDGMPAATVPGMASQAMEDDMMEVSRGEYMKQQARKPGDTFKAFGQTFHDKDVLEMDSMFESWDNHLNSLLQEYKGIQEGMTVSISKGQQGSPDSVSVSAQDGEADKLLSIIKQAGLGLFGGDEGHAQVGVPTGADSHGGLDVVGDHDGMMALIKKSTGGDMAGTLEPSSGSEDYADEEGSDELDMIKQLKQALGGEESHDHEEACNECGMAYESCGCDHGDKEIVDEVESEDQQLYNVAEDNPPDSGAAEFQAMDQEVAADNDAASSHGGAVNSNLEEAEEECEECGHTPCDCDHEEKVEESYANADDDGFEADIDFMTKIISGGLNKQKSTGQTTIPVIAGQNDREGYSVQESVADWKALAGLK